MSMKTKIISALALTTAFTFASSSAVAAEALSQGTPAPSGKSQVINSSSSSVLGSQEMQYDALNNQMGYANDSNTGMDLLGNRIRVSGYLNVGGFAQQDRSFLVYAGALPDSIGTTTVQKSGQSGINYSGRLFLNADVNSWVHANVGLFYAGTKDPIGVNGNAFMSSRYYGENGFYTGDDSEATLSNVGDYDGIAVDEAYVDFNNFNRSPIAVRLGRAYTPFGYYDQNAAVPTFAQILETTRADLVQVAYSGKTGLYGAAYAFNGLSKGNADNGVNSASSSDDDINNGGVEVGYHGKVNNFGQFKYNVSAGYVANMLSAGSFSSYLSDTGYTDRVGAWHVHGDMLFGAFGLSADYVSAATDISADDMVRVSSNNTAKAKPSAGDLFGSFHFITYGHRSAVKVGYEWSTQAALFSNADGNTGESVSYDNNTQLLSLPKARYEAQYNIDVLPNTTVGVGIYHDDSYSANDGGSGNASTTEWVRVTVAM